MFVDFVGAFGTTAILSKGIIMYFFLTTTPMPQVNVSNSAGNGAQDNVVKKKTI